MRIQRQIRFAALVLLFFLPVTGNIYAQQQRRRLEVKRANFLKNYKKDGKDIRRIIGNVMLYHDGITLECDSAYEYAGTQKFDAFGKVVITQQGTKLYGDVLYYDGNTKTGKVRGKEVRMVDKEFTLVTRFLDFNASTSMATFFNGGIITTNDSRLYSDRGKYNSKTKQYYFGGNVSLQNPDFLVNTDSLEYNTNDDIAHFHGPTRLFNPDGYIYCETGWYNRKSNQADLGINAFIDYGAQKVYGDKIFYDKENGYAHSKGNVVIIDSTQNTIIYGGEAKYWEQNKDALITDNPFLVMLSDQGDSLYLRANQLTAKSIPDNSLPDSAYRIFRGIGNVKFYRKDFQGVCDSLMLNTLDSMLYMYVNPIVWNEENQLTADKISSKYRDNKIHRMYFDGSAFISSQEDSLRFNQVKGKQMEAHFKEGKLSRLDVNGNGQTVYYIRDKGEIVAANRAESVSLSIFIRENVVSSILFRSKPTATLFPINKVEFEDITLVGFMWHNDLRPKGVLDIKPRSLNLNFYKPVEGKANLYRSKKKNPAETL